MSDYTDVSFLTEGVELIQSVSERMNLFSDEERKNSKKDVALVSSGSIRLICRSTLLTHTHTHTRIHTSHHTSEAKLH